MEAKFDLFEDEDPHPNLIYQCHEIASESSDVVYSKEGSAPPTPIKITRKQLKEPKSKEKFDELGFLSAYILNQRSFLVLYTGFSDEQMQAIECSPYFIFFQLIGLFFLFQFF